MAVGKGEASPGTPTAPGVSPQRGASQGKVASRPPPLLPGKDSRHGSPLPHRPPSRQKRAPGRGRRGSVDGGTPARWGGGGGRDTTGRVDRALHRRVGYPERGQAGGSSRARLPSLRLKGRGGGKGGVSAEPPGPILRGSKDPAASAAKDRGPPGAGPRRRWRGAHLGIVVQLVPAHAGECGRPNGAEREERRAEESRAGPRRRGRAEPGRDGERSPWLYSVV